VDGINRRRFALRGCHHSRHIAMTKPDTPSETADLQLLDLLTQLLESERAGARGVAVMRDETHDADARGALKDIAKDEARYCAMLSRHIVRLGGTPSSSTGAFYEKLMAIEGFEDRLSLLNRGQNWVARKLQEILPSLDDPTLRADLAEMLEVHERNIKRCNTLK
jgi:nitronate monooxygenase